MADPLLPHSLIVAVPAPAEALAGLGEQARMIHAAAHQPHSLIELAHLVRLPVGVVHVHVTTLHAAGVVDVAPTVEPGTRMARRVRERLPRATLTAGAATPGAPSARVSVLGPQAREVVHGAGTPVHEITALVMAPPASTPEHGSRYIPHTTCFTRLVADDVTVFLVADPPTTGSLDRAVGRDTVAVLLTVDEDDPDHTATIVEYCRGRNLPVMAVGRDGAGTQVAHESGAAVLDRDVVTQECTYEALEALRPQRGAGRTSMHHSRPVGDAHA